MNVVVASGKGGTGKTTIATSLAMVWHEHAQQPVKLLDCDVEAPNAHLVLQPTFTEVRDATIAIPQFNAELCTSCKLCVESCRFNALIMMGETPQVLNSLCHGCGYCTLQCPTHAITEVPHAIGQLSTGITEKGLTCAQGELIISEPMSSPVIRQLKEWQLSADAVNILDAPPGASCPVVQTLRHADFAILVTEPTPFGLHDLKQIVQVAQQMDIPHAVIINRSNLAQQVIEPFCAENNIPVIMQIPFDKDTAAQLAAGSALIDIHPQYRDNFEKILQSIHEIMNSGGQQ
jgi:MinD superfamily P-loop ATPase